MYDIILFIMRVLPPLWQYGLSTLSLQAQERLTAVLHRKLKRMKILRQRKVRKHETRSPL